MGFEIKSIREAKEKTPFSEAPAREVFKRWCDTFQTTDLFMARFVPREEWEEQENIFKESQLGDTGVKTLILPEDLHFWEMIEVIEPVSQTLFKDKPELIEQKQEEIRELGEEFQQAGVYFEEYLPEIKNGRELAQNLALELYSYGLSLEKRVHKANQILPPIKLTPQEKQKMDKWFLGDKAYQKRIEKLGPEASLEEIEEKRKEILNVVFDTLSRKGYQAEMEDPAEVQKLAENDPGIKPWEIRKGPRQKIQEKMQIWLNKRIRTPGQKLDTVFLKVGMEELSNKMEGLEGEALSEQFLEEKTGRKVGQEKKTLAEALEIQKLKQELARLKETAGPAEIAQKELEITAKIQKAVTSFPYDDSAQYPATIFETKKIDCLGSVFLGGGLLKEAGVDYLYADVLPDHALIFVISSDGKVHWRDLTPPPPGQAYDKFNHEITDKELAGNQKNTKAQLQIKDLLEFASQPKKHPKDKALTLKLLDPSIQEQVWITLFEPENGLTATVWEEMGRDLRKLGENDPAKYEESITALEKAIEAAPENVSPYHELAITLQYLKRYDEAIKACRKAIELNPEYVNAYSDLGHILYDTQRYKDALAVYEKAIELNPKYPHAYNGLGNTWQKLQEFQKAIQAFQKFIELWKGDDYWSDRAKQKIAELAKEAIPRPADPNQEHNREK